MIDRCSVYGDMSSVPYGARFLSEMEESVIPGWLIVLFVVLGLVLLFVCCVCFTVRCFTSQGKRGELWSHTVEGQRWVDQWRWGEILPNLVYENDQTSKLPCGAGNKVAV